MTICISVTHPVFYGIKKEKVVFTGFYRYVHSYYLPLCISYHRMYSYSKDDDITKNKLVIHNAQHNAPDALITTFYWKNKNT